MNRFYLWCGVLLVCVLPSMALADKDTSPSTRSSGEQQSPLAQKVAKLLKDYRDSLRKDGNRVWAGRRGYIGQLAQVDWNQLTTRQLQGVVQVFTRATRDMWLINLRVSAACSKLRKAPPSLKKRLIHLWVQHLRDKDASIRRSASTWCLRRMGIAAIVKDQLSKAAPSQKPAKRASQKPAPTTRQTKP